MVIFEDLAIWAPLTIFQGHNFHQNYVLPNHDENSFCTVLSKSQPQSKTPFLIKNHEISWFFIGRNGFGRFFTVENRCQKEPTGPIAHLIKNGSLFSDPKISFFGWFFRKNQKVLVFSRGLFPLKCPRCTFRPQDVGKYKVLFWAILGSSCIAACAYFICFISETKWHLLAGVPWNFTIFGGWSQMASRAYFFEKGLQKGFTGVRTQPFCIFLK